MFRPITPQLQRVSLEDPLRRLVALAAAIAVATLLIALPAPFDLAIVVAPVGALLLFLAPFVLPLALIASVPVQDLAPVPAGVPLTATRAALAAGLAMTPILVLLKSWPIRFSRLMLIVFALVSVMVASLLNATNPSAGYPEMYRWVVALVAFWLVIQFVETRRHAIIIAAVMAFLAIGQGGLGAAQALTGFGPESFEIGMGLSRAYGTFGMPNSYAAYMETVTIPLIPIAIWAIVRFRDNFLEYRRARLQGFLASRESRTEMAWSALIAAILACGVVVGLIGIAFSFSRGGWLGLIAALVVIVVLLGRRAILAAGSVSLAAGIALLVGASGTIVDVLAERFSQIVEQVQIGDIRGITVTTENFAAVERMAHWQTAIAMWSDHPWLGIGVGNFDTRFSEYAVHPYFLDSQGHAHNYYLHLLAEMGVLGLTVYLSLLIGALLLGWKAYRSSDALARAIGIASIGLTAALVVHNLFENLHVLNISVQIVAVWGLAYVATRWAKSEEPGSHKTEKAGIRFNRG